MEELGNKTPEAGIPIRFQLWDCEVRLERYTNNNRIAIMLDDIGDGMQIACATINIPEEELADDQVIIKDYSENEGMLGTLIGAHIVTVPWRRTNPGNHPVCRILLPAPAFEHCARPQRPGTEIFEAFQDAHTFLDKMEILPKDKNEVLNNCNHPIDFRFQRKDGKTGCDLCQGIVEE